MADISRQCGIDPYLDYDVNNIQDVAFVDNEGELTMSWTMNHYEPGDVAVFAVKKLDLSRVFFAVVDYTATPLSISLGEGVATQENGLPWHQEDGSTLVTEEDGISAGGIGQYYIFWRKEYGGGACKWENELIWYRNGDTGFDFILKEDGDILLHENEKKITIEA